jgi:hypothetical protein
MKPQRSRRLPHTAMINKSVPQNIATCKGVGMTKLTDSRSDKWIYWCSFTTTINSDSLQSLTVYDSLHSLLAHGGRLAFCYNERRISAHTLNCLEQCLSLESTLIHFWLLNSSIVYFGLSLCTAYAYFTIQSSELFYDWRFTANHFVLATSPLRTTTTIFVFKLNICSYSSYVTSSLTRGWVCRLKLLMAFASALILGSEPRGTHDPILLSQIRDSHNLEGQVPVFLSPRNRVGRL